MKRPRIDGRSPSNQPIYNTARAARESDFRADSWKIFPARYFEVTAKSNSFGPPAFTSRVSLEPLWYLAGRMFTCMVS